MSESTPYRGRLQEAKSLMQTPLLRLRLGPVLRDALREESRRIGAPQAEIIRRALADRLGIGDSGLE